MNQPIIECLKLSKKYVLTKIQPKFIRSVITRNVQFIPQKENFWALKNISFNIYQGETIGVIGPNGAGKSTLLKILANIITPTSGKIILRGTIGSLLEVGAGFRGELTGRENVYLAGAILGIPKVKIDKQFTEIVNFSGVKKFIDIPVKYYSSGMYIRLAFSVTIQLEPDILLVDEVFAVGDNKFQEASLKKMEEICSEKKRTIIFISHNMDFIKRLCKKVYLIKKGRIVAQGDAEKIIKIYLDNN